MARNKPTDGSSERTSKPRGEASQDELFRRWLEQQLHKRFDPVLEEPVPDDLIALLRNPKPEEKQD